MFSPYKNHKKTPVTKIKYVVSDKPSVDLLFQTWTTCGIKAIVVKNAAAKPQSSTWSNILH